MLRRVGILAIVLSAVSSAAMAVDQSAAGYWTVVIGGEGRITPRWQGSDGNYIFVPTPFLDIRKAGTPEHLYGARDGFGIALFDNGALRIGPVGKIRLPRKEGDDSKLTGLGDVGTAYEAGVFVDYYWGPWLRTRAEVRQGWGGHDGIVSDITADFIGHVSPQLTLSGGPRITFASTRATAPYFSITPAQSAGSGLPVFDAKGGVRSIGAGAQARYLWNRQWGTHVFVEYERLEGDAKNSPLVSLRGSPDQWTFGFGITYAFDVKALW
ncbi:MAG TPA: MipA/OmpV family protein [Xanthobacteraceae bacterium]|nr:MipA/OmpV family protein [Xanthobacteraceae bacterium]